MRPVSRSGGPRAHPHPTSKEAIDRAVAGSVPRMESALPDSMLAAARAVTEVAERDGELAPVY
ncbi:hypothetical protein [Methylobacterium oryzae]|uniref:hypothetical protein n=1 Tax=Methylobacterium oryzae TaxID=334852 RepID=UPI003AF73E15